jgi:cell division protein FtsA
MTAEVLMTTNSRKVIKLEDSTKKHPREAPVVSLYTNTDDHIFALDIGTRTVVGLVGIEKDDHFDIIAADILEHSSRAMLDGQIHDIAKVAAGAKKIKESLEAKVGYPLKKVAIAAAGRVLKTCQVLVERTIDEGRQIDAQLVSALEMQGIQKAQQLLETEILKNDRNPFYCVGFSVVESLLNDCPISNLIGHKGYKVGMQILATFLPHMVVDSLYTVMERIGLEVTSMTLEPIAALNIAIPKDLRMLNLALVDVGAGTSDIAITKGGSVIGYSMVPIAGDELTEAIAQHYLVDFNTAEKMKLDVCKGLETIEFTDILDNRILVLSEEVQSIINPVILSLAQTISDKIKEANGGKSPNAIFLVGGGSQAPGLCAAVASLSGLAKDRVAVRNRTIAKNISYQGDILQGPECITPFGILVTAAQLRGKDFFHVMVNEKKIKLYNARKMSVSDALLLAGFVPDQLIGKSGKNLRFTLNGMEKIVRGEHSIPAEIQVNDLAANLTTPVVAGDRITVKEAEKGADAKVTVGYYIDISKPVRLVFKGMDIEIRSVILLNGKTVPMDTVLSENDCLYVGPPENLMKIAADYEIDKDQFTFLKSGEVLTTDYQPVEGDVLHCEAKEEVRETLAVMNRSSNIGSSSFNFSTLSEITEKNPSSLIKGHSLHLPFPAGMMIQLSLVLHLMEIR